jgi:hypothetical protein
VRSLIDKLIKKEEITDWDLDLALTHLCDHIHYECSNECPIYRKYEGNPPKNLGQCSFFKNGKKMLEDLRK